MYFQQPFHFGACAACDYHAWNCSGLQFFKKIFGSREYAEWHCVFKSLKAVQDVAFCIFVMVVFLHDCRQVGTFYFHRIIGYAGRVYFFYLIPKCRILRFAVDYNPVEVEKASTNSHNHQVFLVLYSYYAYTFAIAVTAQCLF